MSRVNEPFGAVPKRLAEALYAGELAWDEFAILAWLELKINYRVSPPVWRGTTRDMAEAMRWPHGVKYLGRLLRGLHGRGWIESTAQPRSPKPYTVRLLRGSASRTGAGLEPDWNQTGTGSGPVRFQSEGSRFQSEGDPIPHGQDDCDPAAVEAGSSPQKQNSERITQRAMSSEFMTHDSSIDTGTHSSSLNDNITQETESLEALHSLEREGGKPMETGPSGAQTPAPKHCPRHGTPMKLDRLLSGEVYRCWDCLDESYGVAPPADPLKAEILARFGEPPPGDDEGS